MQSVPVSLRSLLAGTAAGAKWTGLQFAFVARGGRQKFPLAQAPDIGVFDPTGPAEALIAWNRTALFGADGYGWPDIRSCASGRKSNRL